jgi:hypothetical protein
MNIRMHAAGSPALRRPARRLALSAALVSAGLGLGAGLAGAQQAGDGIPRMPDGRPDLSGTWDNGSGIDFVRPQQLGESVCIRGCAPAPGAAAGAPARPQAAAPPPVGTARPKYKPEFEAKVADLNERQVEEDPVLRCSAPGVPRIGPPDKIVQRADEIVFLYDDVSGNFFRIVPTDGRPHPTINEPSFLGDAIGHWEGDTLVVETVNFNGETWLTDDGSFHTKDLRVVERIRRTADALEWVATAYDPAVLAEPWQLRPRIAQLTDLEIVEAPPCIERDLAHVVDGTHHDNPR